MRDVTGARALLTECASSLRTRGLVPITRGQQNGSIIVAVLDFFNNFAFSNAFHLCYELLLLIC